jgi:hypothetical protein
MTWTTFANLTSPTLPELDANFNILSGLAPIPCTIAGTNALTLTNIASAGAVTAYANYMRFTGIAANTNSGSATAAFGTLAALNIYKDTPSGPALLVGNEIVQNNQVTLIYDSALNASVGGFHLLVGGASGLVGQTVTAATLNLTANASIASIATIGNVNAVGYGSLGTLFVGATGEKITRMNWGSITLGTLSIANGAASLVTVTVTGAQVNDMAAVGPPAQALLSSFILTAIPLATNSVLLAIRNTGGASATVAAGVFNVFTEGNT